MSTTAIRPARLEDAPAVRQLLVETWHDTYDSLIGSEKVTATTDRWHAITVLERQIVQADLSFLVALQGERLVGHACVHADHLPALRLGRLYVLPEAQRQGVGARLLAAAIEEYPEGQSIALEVQAHNVKAVAFYRKHGFIVCGKAFDDGIMVLKMEKALHT